MRARWATVGAAVLLALSVVAGGMQLPAGSAAGKARVLLVCKAHCPTLPKGQKYYTSIATATTAAQNGDWVLVWPGTYKETVTVDASRGLTSGLHVRGMNRNKVILDGKGLSGSGFHVQGVNNTWVENMTGMNYSVNAFYWTGVDGYWGNYLTGYNNGDYGIYAYDSTCSGKEFCTLAYDYGSYTADSGIYIGGCRDCHAVITNSRAYKNAIGYSGTNAGGELYIMNSEWDHNGSGLVPNTLHSEPDGPQDGAVFYGNYIHDNNETNIPGAGITAIAPVGMGIDVAGGWDNIIRGNLIVNQKHAGVMVHYLITPSYGNQVRYNRFINVGYSGNPGDADIAFDGTSLQNCVDHNYRGKTGKTPATTDPMDPAGLQDCMTSPTRASGKGFYGPGDPIESVMVALNAAGVIEAKKYTGPGPRPDALQNMPNVCKGVPDNAWCKGGKLVVKV